MALVERQQPVVAEGDSDPSVVWFGPPFDDFETRRVHDGPFPSLIGVAADDGQL